MSANNSEGFRTHKLEQKINKDLASGDEIKTASLLLSEFDKNPELARSLVKKTMEHQNPNGFHLGIKENGDIIVWDPTEHRGVYAGSAPDLAPQKQALAPLPEQYVQPVPEPRAAIEQPVAAAPPPAQGEQRPDWVPPPAVCHEQREFKGLNLGILKIGTFDHKSFGVKVDVGVAAVNPMIGGHTGVDVRAGLPKFGACISPGLDIDENGLQPSLKQRSNFLGLAGEGVNAHVRIGPNPDAHTSAYATALGAYAKYDERLSLNSSGAYYNHDAKAGFMDVVGGSTHVAAQLSDNSGVQSNARAFVGPASVEVGGGVDTDGNQLVRPYSYADLGAGTKHAIFDAQGQVGPLPDARASVGVTTVDKAQPESLESARVQAGVGVSGIGIRGEQVNAGGKQVSAIGVGPDYENP